jgi:Spy/CpxP family protein refolding chaperone
MQKHIFLFSIMTRFSLFAVVIFAAVAVAAQERAPDNQNLSPKTGQSGNRLSLVRQLELTPEQIVQIRRINQETKEILKTAAQRQREARRSLDAAIYADTPSETEVERLAGEFASAQNEVTKLRTKTEFRIRQVLTLEQLARFRELRGRVVQNKIQQRGNRQLPEVQPNQNRQRRRFPLRKRF